MTTTYFPQRPLTGSHIPADVIFFACVANAFAELSALGYFARSHWGFSLSSGLDAVPNSHTNRFIFYHAQDTASAVEDANMFLAWSGDSAEIRRALERNNLKVLSGGNPGERFEVKLAALPL